MSALSGPAGRAERYQAKVKGSDVNNTYKGGSSQRAAAGHRHGAQSVSKVARRMPPPANLPSLKSENLRNGLSVPPPLDNTGWTKDELDSEVVSAVQPKSVPAVGPLQIPSAPQQTKVSEGNVGAAAPHRSTFNSLLWSSITSAGRRPGSFLDQKSALFQEEFPQLAPPIVDAKSSAAKAETEHKDVAYGPGPSLRPQNVASWRDGGGRGVVQSSTPDSPVASSPPTSGIGASPTTATGGGTVGGPSSSSSTTLAARTASATVGPAASTSTGMPHEMFRMSSTAGSSFLAQSFPPFRNPMVPMMGMRPDMKPAVGQPPFNMGPMPMVAPNYQPMMMPSPFAFRPRFVPPNYPGSGFMHPAMARSPFMNPAEFRFRGANPYSSGPPRQMLADDERERPPAIVKPSDLEGFDRLAIGDGGWARTSVDVDYSEKLVFSDEEDTYDRRPSGSAFKRQFSDDSVYGNQRPSADRDRDSVFVSTERRIGSQRDFGARTYSESSSSHSTDKKVKAVRTTSCSSNQNLEGQPSKTVEKCPSQSASGSNDAVDSAADAGEDDVWRHRLRQQSESMSAAVERARKRREEEERRLREEQMAAAREKLRLLDEKFGKKQSRSEREKSRLDSVGSDRRYSETSDGSGDRASALTNKALGRSLDLSSMQRQLSSGGSPPVFGKTDFQGITSTAGKPDPPGGLSQGKVEFTGTAASRNKAEVPNKSELFQRCESLPSNLQSATSAPTPRPSVPPSYRMPTPGYWPIPYDMRAAWAGYQYYHRYMMLNDPHYAAQQQQPRDETSAGRRGTSDQSAADKYDKHEADGTRNTNDTYGYKWMSPDQQAFGMHPGNYDPQLMMRSYNQYMSQYYGFMPDYKRKEFDAVDTKTSSIEQTKSDQRVAPKQARSTDSEESCQKRPDSNSGVRSRHISSEDFWEGSTWQGSGSGSVKAGRVEQSQRSDFSPSEALDDKPRTGRANAVRRDVSPDFDTNRVDASRGTSDRNWRNSRASDIEDDDGDVVDISDRATSYQSPKYTWNAQSTDWKESRHSAQSSEHRKLWMPSDNHSRPSCPPPIPAEQARKNAPAVGTYMSLKRTHSSLSGSSMASSDRKAESPVTNNTKVSQQDRAKESLTVQPQTRGPTCRDPKQAEIPSKPDCKDVSMPLSTQLSKLTVKDNAVNAAAVSSNKASNDSNELSTKSVTSGKKEAPTTQQPEKADNQTAEHPPTKKPKSSSRSRRRRKENREEVTDFTKLNGGGSREFVRGGGGRMHVSAPRQGHPDFTPPASDKTGKQGDVDNKSREAGTTYESSNVPRSAASESKKDETAASSVRQLAGGRPGDSRPANDLPANRRELKPSRPVRGERTDRDVVRPITNRNANSEKASDRQKLMEQKPQQKPRDRTSAAVVAPKMDSKDRNAAVTTHKEDFSSKQKAPLVDTGASGSRVSAANQMQRKYGNTDAADSMLPRLERDDKIKPNSHKTTAVEESTDRIKTGENRVDVTTLLPSPPIDTFSQFAADDIDLKPVTCNIQTLMCGLPEQQDLSHKKQQSPVDICGAAASEEWETASEGSDAGVQQQQQQQQRRLPSPKKDLDDDLFVDQRSIDGRHQLWCRQQENCDRTDVIDQCLFEACQGKEFGGLCGELGSADPSLKGECHVRGDVMKLTEPLNAVHTAFQLDSDAIWNGTSSGGGWPDSTDPRSRVELNSSNIACSKNQLDADPPRYVTNNGCSAGLDSSQLIQQVHDDFLQSSRSWNTDLSAVRSCWWSAVGTSYMPASSSTDTSSLTSPQLGALIAAPQPASESLGTLHDNPPTSLLDNRSSSAYTGVIGSHRTARSSVQSQQWPLQPAAGRSEESTASMVMNLESVSSREDLQPSGQMSVIGQLTQPTDNTEGDSKTTRT